MEEPDWSVGTLKVHLDRMRDANDRRYEERFQASERALGEAKQSLGQRLDGMNEFRQALSDQASKFAVKEEVDRRFNEKRTRLDRIERELAEGRGTKTGSSGSLDRLFNVISAVGASMAVIAAIVALVRTA